MDGPKKAAAEQPGRLARHRVEGALRFWLFFTVIGFFASVCVALLWMGFYALNVLNSTPPLANVPLPIWIIMAALLAGAMVLSAVAWMKGRP